MVERADAVVIGAGLGGLTAAVTLAGQGRRPVVLEQHEVAGGYATGFRRGPYRFDAALHALTGLAPGGGVDVMFKELGIWDRLRLHRLDPLYVLRGGGRRIVAHDDPFRYEAELIRNFPDQAAGIRAYLDEAALLYREVRRLTRDSAEGTRPGLEDFVTRYPTLVRMSGQTWDQAMSRHISDPRARTALGALWVYFGLPPSRCAALLGVTGSAAYLEHGGWYPHGGSQALSEALVEELAVRGGELRCGQLVEHIEVSDGRARALITADGHRIEADLVVSNASAPTTMLQMVGVEQLPGEYVEQVDRPTSSYTTFAVYLGLDRDVFAEQDLTHELFLDDGLDADAAWGSSLRGDWDRVEVAVTDYTSVDPGCAPPGHGVVVLTTSVSWDYADTWGTGGDLANYHENPRYLSLKQRAADVLVERAGEAIPGLREAIRFREASTPLTNHHYTRNPEGAIEGYENAVANIGLGALPHQTPIANLFLAGAWAGGGGMTAAMASGQTAARKAMSAVPAHAPA